MFVEGLGRSDSIVTLKKLCALGGESRDVLKVFHRPGSSTRWFHRLYAVIFGVSLGVQTKGTRTNLFPQDVLTCCKKGTRINSRTCEMMPREDHCRTCRSDSEDMVRLWDGHWYCRGCVD